MTAQEQERFDFFVNKLRKARAEIQKIVVGQEGMIDCILNCLITNNHGWFEGPPGVGKTLGVFAASKILDIRFKAIQFTPDLLPLDLKVTIDPFAKSQGAATDTAALLDKFTEGVVFSNLLLVDEGNRGPQKVQASLLEVMQERHVKIGGKIYPLERPNMVFITTNDIEHEGTHNIAEALADRIMLKVKLGYPTLDEEKRIAAMRKKIESGKINLEVVFPKAEIIELQDVFEELYPFSPDSNITDYAVRLVRHIRNHYGEEELGAKALVSYGPTPRGSSDLLVSASAMAMLEGTLTVTPDHIKKMALPALRGTFILKKDPNDSDYLDHDGIINKALTEVTVLES